MKHITKPIVISASALALLFSSACGSSNKVKGGPQNAAAAAPQPHQAASCTSEGITKDVRTADVDNDGRPDIFKYYQEADDPEHPGKKKTMLTREDIDMNWDGKLDLCRYFDASGTVAMEQLDLDYDGKIDETRRYKAGVIDSSDRDRNNDGRPDIIRRYKDGKLVQKEVDTNDDGQIDRWEYYDGNQLDRVGLDVDHDGKIDKWAKAARTAPDSAEAAEKPASGS